MVDIFSSETSWQCMTCDSYLIFEGWDKDQNRIIRCRNCGAGFRCDDSDFIDDEHIAIRKIVAEARKHIERKIELHKDFRARLHPNDTVEKEQAARDDTIAISAYTDALAALGEAGG